VSAVPIILLAEDNEWDARVTREALNACPTPVEVMVARDGESALAYLQERVRAGATLPCLLLLDLNLPRKDGRELLRDLKSSEDLRRVPVIVLTTSMAPQDIRQAYDLHAAAYLHKPIDPDDYGKIVRAIEEFWIRWSVPPGGRSAPA
jgi:CheY-like chemotaxis protein